MTNSQINLDEHIYFIYQNEEIIGYTTSWQEADDICQKYKNLLWDSSKEYSGSLKKIEEVAKNLDQLTITSEIKFN